MTVLQLGNQKTNNGSGHISCVFAFILLILPCAISAESNPAPSLQAETVQAIDAFLENLHEQTRSNALSAAIQKNSEIVYSKGWGSAQPETRFRIGSVSKVFTAAIAARLVDQGSISWNQPIDPFVPGVDLPESLTFERLSNHTGGVRHYYYNEDIQDRDHYDSAQKALVLFIDDDLAFEPGTDYLYTSYGYNLLAAALEGVADIGFAKLLEREIAKPYQLNSVSVDRIDTSSRMDSTLFDGLEAAKPRDISYKWASGGLRSNTQDLVQFAALFSGQIETLRDEAISPMLSPGKLMDGTEIRHGAGWIVDRLTTGELVLFHDGLVQGGRAHLVAVPEWQATAAIAVNRGSYFSVREGLDLLCLALDLTECPDPINATARDEQIMEVVGLLNQTTARFFERLESGAVDELEPLVSPAFDGQLWANKTAFISSLETELKDRSLTLLDNPIHVQISGADPGSLARISGRFYDRIFTQDRSLRFVFRFDGDAWLLERIEQQ